MVMQRRGFLTLPAAAAGLSLLPRVVKAAAGDQTDPYRPENPLGGSLYDVLVKHKKYENDHYQAALLARNIAEGMGSAIARGVENLGRDIRIKWSEQVGTIIANEVLRYGEDVIHGMLYYMNERRTNIRVDEKAQGYIAVERRSDDPLGKVLIVNPRLYQEGKPFFAPFLQYLAPGGSEDFGNMKTFEKIDMRNPDDQAIVARLANEGKIKLGANGRPETLIYHALNNYAKAVKAMGDAPKHEAQPQWPPTPPAKSRPGGKPSAPVPRGG